MAVCRHSPPLDIRLCSRLVSEQPQKGLEKHKTCESPDYQGEEHEYMVLFAKEYLKTHPDINFFIFGHRHIMLDLMLSRTSRLLIAGDWMKLFSYIVWDGENLFLEQFETE